MSACSPAFSREVRVRSSACAGTSGRMWGAPALAVCAPRSLLLPAVSERVGGQLEGAGACAVAVALQ